MRYKEDIYWRCQGKGGRILGYIWPLEGSKAFMYARDQVSHCLSNVPLIPHGYCEHVYLIKGCFWVIIEDLVLIEYLCEGPKSIYSQVMRKQETITFT